MMNLLHISDIHFRKRYETGTSPYKQMLTKMENPLVPLTACIKEVQNQTAIDLLIISGDLTEDGTAADYTFLKNYFTQLIGDTPIVVTLGNHDSKSQFRQGWLHEAASELPYNQLIPFRDINIVSFDNSVQGNANGFVNQAQLAWLSEVLCKNNQKPLLFITHHHLLKTQSVIPCLPQAPALLDLLQEQPIIGILCGHTHHQYSGRAADKPYFTVDGMSFCGENTPNGDVRFEERYGYNLYQLTDKHIIQQQTKTFLPGKILQRMTSAEANTSAKNAPSS